MEQKTKDFIIQLAEKIAHLEQPIHLLAVCSGGSTIAKLTCSYLKSKGIKVKYYEIWTDIIGGKKFIRKTDFKKEDYTGTAVIVEDVIWQGSALPPIKKMLKTIAESKRVYTIALLDCNYKADYSVFH